MDEYTNFDSFFPLSSLKLIVDTCIIAYYKSPSNPIPPKLNITLDWIRPAIPSSKISSLSSSSSSSSSSPPSSSSPISNPLTQTSKDMMNDWELMSDRSYSILTLFLCFGLFRAYTIPMFNALQEKQTNLLRPLRRMGLIESTYWLSWYIASIPLNILVSLTTTGAIMIAGKWFFLFASMSFLPLFLMHFTFLLAMTSFGLFLSSLVSRPKLVNSILIFFSFILLISTSWYFNFQMGEPSYTYLYSILGLRILVFFMPWMEYGKTWG